ncbi:FAD-dependent oxidoreductase [Cryptosporangium sp. NPDC048952]|uniref:FAD-dependent oxidoreductase n=1 Tax=Cryptosporangium sp. NPDC048952 TaxID=3363961 RepID=UPI00372041AB
MPNYDVAIVGAGPAGSATALRLARTGARVLLLERSHFERPRVGESLSPDINPLLHDLGIELTGAQPAYGIRSHWGGPAANSNLFNPYGTGWYVDRAAFDRHLAERAAAAGADLRENTACLNVVHDVSWTLTLATGATTTATTLVDATGRTARIGRQLGAERIAFDRLVAVTAFVPATDPGGFGLVETVPEGWCYSAPAGAGRLVAMVLTDADLGRDASLTTPERWRATLGPETAARLADAGITDLHVVSAASQRLHRPTIDAAWLAVGDAAMAQDPITGTGVVRALRAAKSAAETVLGGEPLRTGPVPPAPGTPERDRFAAYETALDRETTTYLHRRATYYAAETRWPTAPFWQRRLRTLTAR